MLANKSNTLPIDLKGIANKNGWSLLSYENHIELALALDRKSPFVCDGWTVTYDDEIFIFFRNSRHEGRNRFTVAHEFGHLALHHIKELKREEFEQEANMFAARILMPLCILKECHVQTPEEIANLCHTSIESARYRAERLKIVSERNMFYKSPLERQVAVQFRDYIINTNKERFPPRLFHQTLRELRTSQKYTQREIAEILDVTVQDYFNFEHGKLEHDISMLIKLSEFFKVSLNYLLGAELPKDNIEILFQSLTVIQRRRVMDFIHGIISEKD